MSVLNNLKDLDKKDIAGETDRLGGATILDSAVYDAVIKLAYLDVSKGGANSMNLLLDIDGAEVKQTMYFTNKAGLPYWERDGKKNFLPGYNQSNALCLLTAGKELAEMATEKKLLKLYDFEAKKEVPQEKEVLTDLIGESISIGLLRQTVDKNVKDATGKYVPSGETRDENEIDKLFRASDGLTVTEIRAEETVATFRQQWSEKNTGVTKMKAKGAAGGSAAGAPGAPGAAAPAPKLFGA
jgi:hypothetical protein